MEDIRYWGKLDYRIENVGFVSVVRNKDFTFEYKKGKKQYSFIYVQNGELEYNFAKDDKTLRITKGDLLFVPKKLPYKTKYITDNTKIKIFVFDCVFQGTNKFFTHTFLKNSDDIATIFHQCTSENARNTLFLLSKIYEILYVLSKFDKPIDKKYRKIMPAITKLKQDFTQNQKMSYYANLCNMSESNFRKLFKEYVGASPIEFRNHLRIEEVKKMTDSGEYRVSEAAYAVGFNNMSFFYEEYKKYKNN